MMKIGPVKRLFGELLLPGDKSISHRAVMLGALANGKTTVSNILECDDCNYTIKAFRDMGIDIQKDKLITTIHGKGLKGLSKPRNPIYTGDSGTTMRIMAGILAGQDFESTLTGDASLSKRPMARVTEPLSLMGADIRAKNGEYPPITIKPSALKPVEYKTPVPSAQIKSAVLFAALYAKGVTKVTEEYKSRDHTERMMRHFGADIKVKGLNIFLKGGRELQPRQIAVPSDISSASFFIVGATLLAGSKVRIKNVSVNPTRAGILNIISKMGGKVKILNKRASFEPTADIFIQPGHTHGITINENTIPSIIDELPIIFVLAALSKGKTVIKGAGELKVKETDRIKSMSENLAAMGAKIEAIGNDIVIEGVRELKGASLKSFGDHRTCMSMAIAAFCAKGDSTIDDISCVNKSFPEFFQILNSLKK